EIVVAGADAVFVARAAADIRDERLPDPGVAARRELGAARLPVVEVADDTDALSVRCPEGEVRTLRAGHRPPVCTELRIEPVVRPFVEPVQVVLRQDGSGLSLPGLSHCSQ